MTVLVAYAWLAVVPPRPRCVLRETIEGMPGRCLLWGAP